MSPNLKIVVDKSLITNSLSFFCIEEDTKGTRLSPGLLMSEEIPMNTAIASPTFQLSLPQAQSLADSLWAIGIRPTASLDASGQIGAMKYHLEDMRTIAMEMLSLKK